VVKKSNIEEQIEEAVKVILKGGVVAFPTETVYGLGADAFNPQAVAKIFIAKERPTFDPLIVHISKIEQLEAVVKELDPRLLLLAEKFWPGPLTIVTLKNEKVPDIVTSALPTVGVRMPSNPIALEFIERCNTPIAAPSANRFGRVSPTLPSHVRKELPNVATVIDGGGCEVGIESTVIALNKDGFSILREGAITKEELLKLLPLSKEESGKRPSSPGMLNSHYSPQKPLYIIEESTVEEIEKRIALLKRDGGRVAFISFTGIEPKGAERLLYLSKSGNLKEAALNLFKILHLLEDDDRIDFIVAERIFGGGISRAIMDRLKRASYRYTSKE